LDHHPNFTSTDDDSDDDDWFGFQKAQIYQCRYTELHLEGKIAKMLYEENETL